MSFILYTSGSTGKPKGVYHSTGGYLTYAAHTSQLVFNLHEDDIHWCTADVGWITGHTYLVYGPLALGATVVMFEGAPNYPAPDRFWRIVEKFKVTTFYTAPTAIRALMREGDRWTKNSDLSSLRVLGSVGEPINPEAWMWYHTHIGKGKTAHRGHLVADRNRGHHGRAPALRHAPQAGQRHPAHARHAAQGGEQRR